jgi:HAD superfamily hydrolase (TIGR01549 family)
LDILNKKKVFIFDLDGTLINSAKTVLKILNSLNKNKKIIKMKDLRNFLSLGGNQLIKNILKIKDINEIVELKKLFRAKYFREKSTKKDLYSGAISLLLILRQKKLKICLCTNKPNFLVKKIIKDLKINHLFDLILTPDNLNVKKPNSVFIKKILNKYKIKNNEATYIGDSNIDMKLAQNNKIDFFLFYNKNCDIKKYKLGVLKKNKQVFNNYNLFIKKIIGK